MMTVQLHTKPLDTGTFQVDFQSLIKVLGENLYANPKACVRELIQNANDSCVRRQSAGQPFKPSITVRASKGERVLIFEDNGAGMVHEDVVCYLASIGGGRTREERQRLSTEDKDAANMLIGQFGIGFLSSFVVADRVVVDTLSIEGGEPVRWVCEGTAEYQIGLGERAEPGTRVMLYLKPAHFDLLEEEILYNTIVYYADFIGFPIYLNEHTTKVNRMHAPWHTSATYNEYAAYIDHRYGVMPLAMEPIAIERDDLAVQGVLFIPPRSGEWKRHLRSIDIFQKRMFIGEDLHILPEWAGFISGVLDCATLELVASRESAISERESYRALQTYLGQTVAAFIQKLAKQERSTFLEVIKQHEWAVKWGAVRDDFFFDQVKDLIPIASDMGTLTIPKYLQRAPKRLGGMKTIYYVPGTQTAGQQQSSVFRARGVPIFRTDVVDEQFLKKYVAQKDNVNLRQMVSGVVELMDFVEGEQWRTLEKRYEAMSITARGVRFHPPEMPALAVRNSDYDQDRMVEQVVDGSRALFDLIGHVGKETSDIYGLCFNIDNPIIKRLSSYQGDEAILEAALRAIYSSALLAAGVELTAELSQSVAQSEMRVIELLLEQDQRLQSKGQATGYAPSSVVTAATSKPKPTQPWVATSGQEAQAQKKSVTTSGPFDRPYRDSPEHQWSVSRTQRNTADVYAQSWSHPTSDKSALGGDWSTSQASVVAAPPYERPFHSDAQEEWVLPQREPAPQPEDIPDTSYERPFRDTTLAEPQLPAPQSAPLLDTDAQAPYARPFRDPEHASESLGEEPFFKRLMRRFRKEQ